MNPIHTIKEALDGIGDSAAALTMTAKEELSEG